MEWMNHKGSKIFFTDFSGLDPKNMIDRLNASFEEIEKASGPIKLLANYEATSISPKFIEAYAAWGKKIKSKVDRNAVYGLNLAKRVMLKTFNTVNDLDIRVFETREEALDYLTK
ncbi:hypothetical protein SAMN05421823_110265 [Catalinimonas alkaloidigena]|uniref:SpoIIAA-like n=1 Tax=Catalinimonas alkaloidigena TaxID=1075417 RepID=A0A1G9QQW0_9BACT|nr:STAS/SEC14 domain-containing protein [Catalinimonas alkaloidigena]SDM13409.1 hypothetical protein SAMN05421823_110265 [Catalinimonas alkaloidigena]